LKNVLEKKYGTLKSLNEMVSGRGMTQEEFKKLVAEGIKMIPKRFLEKLSNVAICIEDTPSGKQGLLLLGLYEGVPQTDRQHYGQVLPDKITIFKKPIERIAESKAEVRQIVADTVWHEIAHHFGMDEGRVRRAERKRKER